MRELGFARFSTDLGGIVLSDIETRDEYFLPVEEPLLKELDRLLISREEAESGGDDDAGKISDPVVDGRLQMLPNNEEEAIAAVRAWKPSDNGPSESLPVEDALTANLKKRMVRLPADIFDESWSGERRKGGGWIVGFSFLLAGQPRTAEWVVDNTKREIRAGNSLSEELQVFNPGKAGTAQSDKSKARLGRRRRA